MYRVLLVEDRHDTLCLMQRLLQRLGYTVTCATQLDDAMDLAQWTKFDAAIIDLHLTGAAGLDFVRQLRAIQPFPCLAVTASVGQEDIDETKRAGYSQHLLKPLSLAEMDNAIRACVVRRPLAFDPSMN